MRDIDVYNFYQLIAAVRCAGLRWAFSLSLEKLRASREYLSFCCRHWRCDYSSRYCSVIFVVIIVTLDSFASVCQRLDADKIIRSATIAVVDYTRVTVEEINLRVFAR